MTAASQQRKRNDGFQCSIMSRLARSGRESNTFYAAWSLGLARNEYLR